MRTHERRRAAHGSTIRRASGDDAPALAALSHTLGYPSFSGEVRKRLRPLLYSNDDRVLVACMPDGSVVAWVHVYLARRVETDMFAEVGGLVVAENRRGMGIAGLLMRAAEKWAVTRGAHKLRVRSRSSRTGAHAFYRHLGFARIKRQEVFEKPLRSGR